MIENTIIKSSGSRYIKSARLYEILSIYLMKIRQYVIIKFSRLPNAKANADEKDAITIIINPIAIVRNAIGVEISAVIIKREGAL